MAVNCRVPEPSRKKYGYPEQFVNTIKKAVGEPTSAGSLRNIARKLGVDDQYTLNIKGPDGKKVFGGGLKDASEWTAGSQIPKDVVVTVPSKMGGEQWFMSGNKTNLPPSKWYIENGDVVKNPDWDMVGVNQTVRKDGDINAYVKDRATGHFRPPRTEEGEVGEYFLNVQNPVRYRNGITNDQIVRDNIDAFEHGPNVYQVVDEKSQVVKIGSDIRQKEPSGSLESSVVREEPNEQTVFQELLDLGVPQQAASTLAGSIAGDMIDEEGQFGGTFWGGALGFALSNGRFRSKITGTYKKVTGGADEFDEVARGELKAQKETEFVRRAQNTGYSGNDLDGAREYMENVGNQIETARNNGVVPREGVFQNDWFESLKGLLSKLGVQRANKLYDVFQGFEQVGSELYSKLNRTQVQLFGRNGKQQMVDTVVNKVTDFNKNLGVDATRQQAINSFGEAVFRIRTYGAKLDEAGNLAFDESMGAARQTYRNNEVMGFDRFVLQDQELRQALDTYGNYYESIRKDIQTTLSQKITNLISGKIKGAEAKEVADQIHKASVNEGLSYEEFLRANPSIAKQAKTFKSEDKVFEQFLDMNNDYVRFSKLEGRYVPQKMDTEKLNAIRQDFLSNPNRYDADFEGTLDDLPFERQQEVWNNYVAKRILANHRDRFKALILDDSQTATNIKYFEDWDDAVNEVRLLQRTIRDEEVLRLVSDDIDRGLYDLYVKKEVDSNGKSRYFLETPDKYKEADINVFAEDNVQNLATSYQNFHVRNMKYTSDHYDRPRNYVLPAEFLVTDMEQLAKHYSYDVGMRLHNIKNDMYNTGEFEREWMQSIREDLQKNGMDEKRITRELNRVRDWYSTVQGIRKDITLEAEGMTREQMQQQNIAKIKNESFIKALGNMTIAPFLYGVTHYSLFQPAVMLPFIAGWKNTAKTYGYYLKNPEKLKYITDELKNLNVTRESYYAFDPEAKAHYRKEIMGNSLSPRQEKFLNYTDKFVDFSANLSLAKPLLSKMGVDLEQKGLLRLAVGNMMDISGAEAGLATMGTLKHVDDLVGAFKELEKGSPFVEINGRRFSRSDVMSDLQEMGVQNPEMFARNKDKFNQYIEYLEGGEFPEMDDVLYKEMARIMNRAVDLYHARSKDVRPLNWIDNPFGRLFSRFATYGQNMAVNITQTRIYRPMRDWNDRYGQLDNNTNLFKLAHWAATGNDTKFKQAFGDNWEQAYNDFPVQAVNNAFKVLGAIGVGHVMMMTRSAQMDLIGMVSNEAMWNDDYEMWRASKRRLELYTDPDTNEPVYLSDAIGDGVQAYDIMKMLGNTMGIGVDLGFASKWGTMIDRDLRFADGGPLNTFPAGSAVTDIWERSNKLIYETQFADLPRQLGKEFTEFGLTYGSSFATYYDARKAFVNGIFKKPANRNVKYQDATTGLSLDLEVYDP